MAFITRTAGADSGGHGRGGDHEVRRVRRDRRWDGRGEAEATDESLRNVRDSGEHVVRVEPP